MHVMCTVVLSHCCIQTRARARARCPRVGDRGMSPLTETQNKYLHREISHSPARMYARHCVDFIHTTRRGKRSSIRKAAHDGCLHHPLMPCRLKAAAPLNITCISVT